jgi:hypothetical protein
VTTMAGRLLFLGGAALAVAGLFFPWAWDDAQASNVLGIAQSAFWVPAALLVALFVLEGATAQETRDSELLKLSLAGMATCYGLAALFRWGGLFDTLLPNTHTKVFGQVPFLVGTVLLLVVESARLVALSKARVAEIEPGSAPHSGLLWAGAWLLISSLFMPLLPPAGFFPTIYLYFFWFLVALIAGPVLVALYLETSEKLSLHTRTWAQLGLWVFSTGVGLILDSQAFQSFSPRLWGQAAFLGGPILAFAALGLRLRKTRDARPGKTTA